MRRYVSKFQMPGIAYVILLFPLGILLSYGAASTPEIIEGLYSNQIYKIMSQPLSRLTGLFPFSVAEILVIALVLFCLWRITVITIKAIKRKTERGRLLFNFLIHALVLGSLLYFGFITVWGLNYHREPFSQIAGLDIQPASVDELVKVCEDLIQRANGLRDKVNESSAGTMRFPGGTREILNQAVKGYENLSDTYPQLGGKYGNPKPVFFSRAMSLTGIWGVYFPFTGEANVNIAIPDTAKPSIACHEMAHQRGFAREDEANYIAWLACSNHPSVEFQYSGTAMALMETMNAVYRHDRNEYKRLYAAFHAGIKRDWAEIDEFNKSSEGIIGEVSNKINDTYLKANLQEDGVYSYGRMVDLLIAEYRRL